MSEFSFSFLFASNFHKTHINIFFIDIKWSKHVEPRRSTDGNFHFHENCRVATEKLVENRKSLKSKRQGKLYA